MTAKFDKYSTAGKKFAQDQFKSYAYSQGLDAADKALKNVVGEVRRKFNFGEIAVDAADFSDGDVLDVAADSATNNTLFIADKCHGLFCDVKNFASGDLATSRFVESVVEKISGFVGKAVKGIAIVTLGIGNIMTLGFVPIPVEFIAAAAGTIASKIFCAIFQPLVNHLRKNEAREAYERLHGFYVAATEQIHCQREIFERVTAELLNHRQNLIDASLRNLDAAFSANDAAQISDALAPLAREFGGELKFKSFAEFNDFMLNSDEELIL